MFTKTPGLLKETTLGWDVCNSTIMINGVQSVMMTSPVTARRLHADNVVTHGIKFYSL